MTLLSAEQLLTASPEELRDHIAEIDARVETLRQNALDAYNRLSAIHPWELLDGPVVGKIGDAKQHLQALLMTTTLLKETSLLEYRRHETP